MIIDPSTLFLVNATSLLVFAAVYAIAWSRGDLREFWLNSSVSEVIFAIAFILFARSIEGNVQTVLLPNMLLVVGLSFRFQAARVFFRQQPSYVLPIGAALVVLGLFLGTRVLGTGFVFGAVNVALLVLMLAIIWTFASQRQQRLPSRWGIVFAYTIVIMSTVARVIEGFVVKPQMHSLLPQDALLTVHLVVAAIHIVASGAFGLSIAYERGNNELRMTALQDALTDLLNRRGLESVLARRPLTGCVLVIDIDHFKSINDSYGHPVGDIVIRRCAHLIETMARENGTIARIGGEEFIAILEGRSMQDGLHTAEKIRAAAEVSPVKHGDDVISYTVSVGVSHTGIQAASFARLMGDADRALYRAKSEGRNCVRTSELTPA